MPAVPTSTVNLKQIAASLSYLQEHGFRTLRELEAALIEANAELEDCRNNLKAWKLL
jgi:hypothetical protein